MKRWIGGAIFKALSFIIVLSSTARLASEFSEPSGLRMHCVSGEVSPFYGPGPLGVLKSTFSGCECHTIRLSRHTLIFEKEHELVELFATWPLSRDFLDALPDNRQSTASQGKETMFLPVVAVGWSSLVLVLFTSCQSRFGSSSDKEVLGRPLWSDQNRETNTLIECDNSNAVFQESNEFLLQRGEPKQPGYYAFDMCRGLGFKELQEFVNDKNIADGDRFLEELKNSPQFSAFFDNYVLMHSSRSGEREDVTPLSPRVIMFLDKLLIAWTGERYENGKRVDIHSNEFVILEFDIISGNFEPRTISFAENRPAYNSREKLDTCKGCHGNSVRPIWENYRNPFGHWLGAFDAGDGRMNPVSLRLVGEFFDHVGSKPNSRYRHLNPEIYKTGAENKENRFLHSPSLKLTHYVYHVNLVRIAKRFWNLPRGYQAALTGAVGRYCHDLEEFFPVPLPQSMDQIRATLLNSLDLRLKWVDDQVSRDGEEFRQQSREHLNKLYAENASRIERFAYVLQTSDFPWEDWSLDFVPGKPEIARLTWQTGSPNNASGKSGLLGRFGTTVFRTYPKT